MRPISRSFLPLAALVLLSAAPAAAQVRFFVNPYVGVFFYDDGAIAFVSGEGDAEGAIGLDASRFVGVRLGTELADRLSVEADFGFASLSGEPEDVGDFDVDEVEGNFALYGIGVGFNLTPGRKLASSLHLGIAGARTDFDLRGTESFTDVAVTVGLGASYEILPHVLLRGDVGGVMQFCDVPEETTFAGCLEEATLAHIETSGGVKFRF